MNIDELCINTIRTLAIDAIQKANSGHPGAPMALAPAAYALWTRIMRYNPRNPHWFDRDRFVLSNGHASMLLYAMLHLTGFDVSLEDIKKFRQWGSITPGHPESHLTPGVETTTGPLGQGFMNAVGMAIAEVHLAAVYNRPGHEVVDHHTYVFCGDGDLMEGASHEAASLAGHLKLGKLICLYDDNRISIEGSTDLTFTDDAAKRFAAYHWHVQDLGEKANDVQTIAAALNQARQEKERPSLIILRTHIGFGSPNLQDTPGVHGSPLGEDEIVLTKRNYGWPENEKFLIPEKALEHFRQAVTRGQEAEAQWNERFSAYRRAHPELAAEFEAALKNQLRAGWDGHIPQFTPEEGALATRSASGKVINAIAEKVPYLMGGSADLAPSTNTLIKNSGYFASGQYANRNLAWGVREHTMCASSSGMALHSGVRPFVATFFVFTDYARPAIRLAALMGLPVIYVMTHDSIGLGEDGPTHQPIEQLSALRAMPNLTVIRPADANEVAFSWRAALLRQKGPTMLVLTRQKLPILDRRQFASAEGVLKGAYVLSREKGDTAQVLLLATGSEVHLILAAQEKLLAEGIQARVVSMPSWELFDEQPQSYRDEVLSPLVKARVAVEAATPLGWRDWVGDAGKIIGITQFGASAPYQEIYQQYGLTVENIIQEVKALL
ncbi:MAG: transketolase [bacterium]